MLLGLDTGDEDKLNNLNEERKGFRELWIELSKVWENVSGMEETLLIYSNP